MIIDDPKPVPEVAQKIDAQEIAPMSRESFDILQLQSMLDEEAEAEWLRRPEAWHMH
ncbi:MAG: hypothetical protein KF889_18235 [Alphaproteobacteria bacterium]|nr:hypothetical protein [Alphaproteobacteria bacterium]MCW5743993.1 hypothetical protein [Alphaproteobacteria bacterium]